MSEQNNIPEAAVEAAAKALSIHTMIDDSPENETFREAVRLEARRALEAAAPHMLREAKAAAWDEGSWQGYREGADDELTLPAVDNPYRPTP